MVKSKEELLRASNAWVREALDDVASKINEFCTNEGVSVEEVASTMDIEDDIDNIFDGDDIMLSTFAKLLIANGFALEIKPVEMTPLHSFREDNGFGIPPRSARKMQTRDIHRGTMSRPVGEIEEDDIDEMPRAHKMPTRDAHGRFVSSKPKAVNDPFVRLSLDALRDIIRKNNWHYEIDLRSASRNELIDFLKEKERRFGDKEAKPEVKTGDKDIDRMLGALGRFLKANPDVLKEI